MASFPDTFNRTFHYKENGLDIAFPQLDIDDHAAWTKELHDAQKPVARSLVPPNALPSERQREFRKIEFTPPTLDEISQLILTAPGARTCLIKSLVKAGKPKEEAEATVKKILAGHVVGAAIEVSGLFESRPPPVDQKPDAANDPLAQSPPAGGGEPTSISPTGAGQCSSSVSTSANPLEPCPSGTS